MKIGTRSVLFGVHAFWFHPVVVLLAWRKLYKSWPKWWQLVGIILHDTPGYWGKPNIDGAEGKQHPYRGARLAAQLVVLLSRGYWRPKFPILDGEYGSITYWFTLLHSRDMAAEKGRMVSELYAADKASILFDPKYFYLLRARLSGEIKEFKTRAIASGHIASTATDGEWFDFYREAIKNRKGVKELL